MHISLTNDYLLKIYIIFDENRHIYFWINEEKTFIQYMEILEKVSNVNKNKFNSELIYTKNT